MIKKVMASTKKSQWGMALPMALIMLVLASFIVVPSLMAIQSMMKISSKVSQNTLAYYAADAGVADLMWKYKYGTAPTSSYTLTDINNMDVQVSPVGTSGQGYWLSSAPPVPANKAQIYVQVQQTGSQSGGIFDYAVASLNGNIAVNGNTNTVKLAGKVVVVADNTCVVDYCDSAWSAWTGPPTQVDHVSLSTSSVTRQKDVCYDLGRSAYINVTSTPHPGNLAYRTTDTALDISSYNYIWAWICNSAPLNHDTFKFRIATGTGFTGTMDNFTSTEDISSSTSGRWVGFSRVGLPTVSSLNSIGICSAMTGAQTIYVDNVIANNDASPPANPSVMADMYAKGNITIKNYARVGGTASATGTVTPLPATAYAENTTSGVTALANPFTTAYVQNYINQGDAGTDYTSSAGSWNSGTGTITIGPGYIDGDVTLGGSKIFVLTGTIHVSKSGKKQGKLTIKDTATIQGNYTIVSDGDLTISGASTATTMIAADNIPTLLCQGVATVTDSRISANIHVPNEAVTLTTGNNTIPPDFSVYGSVIAKSVTMNNYATVRYPIPVVSAKLVAYDYR